MGQGIDLLGSLTRVIPERPPPAIDSGRLSAALIIKLSSIGDVVHALPVACALKETFPQLHLTWAIEDWAAALVVGHRAIDRVVVFPSMRRWPKRPARWLAEFRRGVRELRAQPYDVALDLQGLARSASLAVLSRAPLRVARQGQREGAHLVSYGLPIPSTARHAVDEYLHAARFLGAADTPPCFDVPVHPDARQAVGRLLAAAAVTPDEPLIVLSPSTSHAWKAWSPERWAQVADGLVDYGAVVIAGGPTQRARNARMVARMRHSAVDLTGQTTLSELVALLDRAALHVGADSGAMHIAAALGRPVAAVYGPTRPSRLAPYGQTHAVVYHGDQCGRLCPAYCVWGQRCLRVATPAELLDKAGRALAGFTA